MYIPIRPTLEEHLPCPHCGEKMPKAQLGEKFLPHAEAHSRGCFYAEDSVAPAPYRIKVGKLSYTVYPNIDTPMKPYFLVGHQGFTLALYRRLQDGKLIVRHNGTTLPFLGDDSKGSLIVERTAPPQDTLGIHRRAREAARQANKRA